MHAFCVCILRPHTRGMAISLLQRRPAGAPPPDGPAGRSGRSAGVAMLLASGLSNQVGAAVGALSFPVIGPAGVVAVRQWVAGVALLAIGRPRVRSYTWPQWWPVLSLALVFATMNLSLYTAIDRIGLGLAVTLEFLGPLSVALAGSRRRVDLVCALLAGAAVAVLARPEPTTDYLGIGLGLLAAVCWACYILLNRVSGRRRHPLLRGPLPDRPAGPAPGPGPVLRGLHERQPRAGRPGRPGHPRPDPAVGRVAGHRGHRERQHGQCPDRRPPGTAASLRPDQRRRSRLARPGPYMVHGGERRGWGERRCQVRRRARGAGEGQ